MKKKKNLTIKQLQSQSDRQYLLGKKFVKWDNFLISNKHWRNAFKKVVLEFLNDPKKLEDIIGDKKRANSRTPSWFQYAVTAEALGYSAFDRLSQMREQEKDVKTARRRPARSIDPALVVRLIRHNDKIGGASKLFGSSYLKHFYKVTKIPECKSIKTLNKSLTEWRRMLGLKVRSHVDFEGSESQKRYQDSAGKKLKIKGYLGKK
tara:strand:- start:1189 stop:1806 length:618 start_codon:yes stop_codon:yes gene_type:complete